MTERQKHAVCLAPRCTQTFCATHSASRRRIARASDELLSEHNEPEMPVTSRPASSPSDCELTSDDVEPVEVFANELVMVWGFSVEQVEALLDVQRRAM
jgi:hypothetical protein